MRYWFTSDTHFGHENIIKYCNRPFKSVEHMNEELISRWNSKVKKEDIVFHIGDFGINSDNQKIMKRLNGHIIWIKGNHDKKTIIQDLVIHHGGRYWHLAHLPLDIEGEWGLCGHVHKLWEVDHSEEQTIVNVGVDVWDFYPVSINDILKRIEESKGL